MNLSSKLFACLRALGIDPKMETFAERKKVQKLVYLLDKVFGISFEFPYNWYLHGPYSPMVTRIVYDVIEARQRVDVDIEFLSEETLQKIDLMKSFLGNDIDSNDNLELLASLHFVMQRARNSGFTLEDAIEFLKTKKPYFTNEEIQKAVDRFQALKSQ